IALSKHSTSNNTQSAVKQGEDLPDVMYLQQDNQQQEQQKSETAISDHNQYMNGHRQYMLDQRDQPDPNYSDYLDMHRQRMLDQQNKKPETEATTYYQNLAQLATNTKKDQSSNKRNLDASASLTSDMDSVSKRPRLTEDLEGFEEQNKSDADSDQMEL
ncbi:hypothetical protein CPB83DRAFT_841370, partial [Crepidotus variabilis]